MWKKLLTSALPNQRNCSSKDWHLFKPNVLRSCWCCIRCKTCSKHSVFPVRAMHRELCASRQYLPSHPTFTTSFWKIHSFTAIEKVSHQGVTAKLLCNKAETSGLFTSTSSCMYFVQLLYYWVWSAFNLRKLHIMRSKRALNFHFNQGSHYWVTEQW